jgi:hypothetical protein
MKLRLLAVIGASFAVLFAARASADSVAVRIEGGRLGSLVRVRASAEGEPVRELSVALSENRVVQMELAPRKHWAIAVESDGFWSAPVEVGSAKVETTLWPASTFRMSFIPPQAMAMPTNVELRLVRANSLARSEANQPGEATLTCRIGAEGDAACTGPRGRWDTRVKCPRYAPSYSWDRAVEAGRTLDLGRIPLREGIALLGKVTTDDGEVDPRAVTVRAVSRVLPDAGSVGTPSQLKSLATTAPVNPWGYFLFDALPAGAYEISASQDGYEGVSQTVVLKAGEDLELRAPLKLSRALHLTVQLDPPIDTSGAPWSIVLRAIRSGDLAEIARGETSDDGGWTSPAIRRGTYSIFVQNRSGDSYAKQEFDLEPGSELAAIQIDLVEVRGRVRVGDDALAADLWFGGRHGDVRAEAESDADGEFVLALPRAGSWKVDVFSEAMRVSATGVDVEVPAPRHGQPVRIEITLPDTEVRGFVHDAQGAPVEGAVVTLVPVGGSANVVTVESDLLGSFSIRGQDAGTYSIEARKSHASSERRQVLLDEELTSPEVNLILRDRRALKGRVDSATGPVAGAWILGFPLTSSGTLAAMTAAQARSGADGGFELEVPPETASVRLVTTALGYTLALSRVSISGAEAAVSIALEQRDGRLELSRPTGGSGTAQLPLLMVDGQPLDIPFLEIWSRAHSPNSSTESMLVVDGMPQATYSYCLLSPDEAMAVFGGSAFPKASACVDGYLSAGGALRLSSPTSPRSPG